MRSALITAALTLGLLIGSTGAQDLVTGHFIFDRRTGGLHLVEHDIRMIPPSQYRELSGEGTYQINTDTGSLSLGESIVVEICEWFGWAPVHARVRISNVLGTVGAVGETIARYAGSASRVALNCRTRIEGARGGRAQ